MSNKRIFQIVAILLALALCWGLAKLGAPAPAMLSFCVLSAAAWAVSDEFEKSVISVVGIVVVLAGAYFVVEAQSKDLSVWWASKLVFVVYFGVFVSQLLSHIGDGHKNVQLGICVCLLSISLLLKYASIQPDDSILAFMKFVNPEGVLYGWPDFFEDVSFGLAGAFAAEIVNFRSSSST